jgi:hypothetical protein
MKNASCASKLLKAKAPEMIAEELKARKMDRTG